MNRARIIIAMRLLLAIVFLYSAAMKLFEAGPAADTVLSGLPQWIQTSLPFGEVAIAGWLLSGISPTCSALITICVLSLFSGVLVLEMGKEHPRPCGCSAAVADAQSPEAVRRSLYFSLGRNVALMAAAGYLFFASSTAAGGRLATKESGAIGDAEPSSS